MISDSIAGCGERIVECRMRALLLSLTCVALSSCGTSGPTLRELDRLPSPDGALDAVLSEVEAGATVSTPYLVFLVLKGQSPEGRGPVLKVDRARKPELTWDKSGNLVVRCFGSRIWHFQNFDVIRKNDGGFLNPYVFIDCAGGGESISD